MDNCPVNCTFAWHGVIPPSHCPHCGRCLGCGYPRPYGPYPRPYGPYPRPSYPVVPRPYWTRPNITVTMSSGSAPLSPQDYL